MKFQVISWKFEVLKFDGFFLSKSYKVSAQKVQKIYLSWHWREIQSLKENWLEIWHEEFGEFSLSHSKVCNFLFDDLFLSKVSKFQATKIRRSYLSWHWTVMRNVSLVSFNVSRGKSENFQFDVLLLSKVLLCLSQKNTEELCVRTLNDAKSKEELICALKNDISNLPNFGPTHGNLKTSTLMDSFWQNYITFKLKNYKGAICYDTGEWCCFLRKIYWCFEKQHNEFGWF